MTLMSPPHALPRQHGAVLFIALIMLILVTLLALAAMRLATTNLQLVNNQQFRAEADAAADYALDQAMNDSTFLTNTTTDTTTSVSLRQDDPSTDPQALQVTVKAPTCKRYGYLKKIDLVDKPNSDTPTVSPENVVCFTGQSSSGVLIVNSGGNLNANSLCADTLFEVQAIITDSATGATAIHTMGISSRMDYTEAENKCK